MLLKITQDCLPMFEALASSVRLNIITLLMQDGDCNIKELALKLGISSPIVLKHIQKLEDAGIVRTAMVIKNGSTHKMCSVINTEYIIQLPDKRQNLSRFYEVDIPVGHYTRLEASPTCGLANELGIIGTNLDDPRFFWEPQRMNAQLIWFFKGFVEYQFPNYIEKEETADEVVISFELSSEAPGYNDDWPSEIVFHLNGVRLGGWVCPGDFGENRGALTPSWWSANQYGLLKTLKINQEGTYIDNSKISGVSLKDVPLSQEPYFTLRLSASPTDPKGPGGLTLYGEKFGNHNQNIKVRVFCREYGPAKQQNEMD